MPITRDVNDVAGPGAQSGVIDLDSLQIAAEGIAAEVNWRLAPLRRESVAILARCVVEDVAAVGLDAAIAGLRARRNSDPLVIGALLSVLLGDDATASVATALSPV